MKRGVGEEEGELKLMGGEGGDRGGRGGGGRWLDGIVK